MNAKREKYIKETVLDQFWTVYNQQKFTKNNFDNLFNYITSLEITDNHGYFVAH